MDGQSSQGTHLQFPCLEFVSNLNEVSLSPEDDTSQDPEATNLPWWIQNAKPSSSSNYVEFLAESSPFLSKAPTEDILNAIPTGIGRQAVNGVSGIHGGLAYISAMNACGSRYADSSSTMDAWKGHTSWVQESSGENCNSQSNSRVTVAAPAPPSKLPRSPSAQRALRSDRVREKSYNRQYEQQRRQRINERLEALQVLLPNSTQGSQASVVDDVIDHIKYLQLQIKDLSQSRLAGEPNSETFIFLEGYGHYISNQQMLNEPLEEMIGKLLEANPLAAAQLLETKGLLLMPLDLVQGLS